MTIATTLYVPTGTSLIKEINMLETAAILETKDFADGLFFGESPRWKNNTLYISDMLGLKVHAFDRYGKQSLVADMPTKPNGMAFLPNGDHIISSMHDTRLYRVTPQGLELYADLSAHFTGYVGDMVTDREGRIYVDDVGARVFEGEPLRPGRLVVVERDGSSAVVAEDMTFPNGIVITKDQRTLIVAETFAEHLTAFDIENGRLVNRRIYRDMSDAYRSASDGVGKPGFIDGIAIDGEDGIWLSMLKGQEFIRINVHGRVTHRIPVPGHECVACTLGGEDGKTLFMAATHMAPGSNIFEEMTHRRTRTRILTARVDVAKGEGRP
jgi:sugar lactone lactonase YvrE